MDTPSHGTWLGSARSLQNPSLDFVINEYLMIRKDRDKGGGGGCATFIRQGIPSRVLERGVEQEYLVIWIKGEEIVIMNYYNNVND